MRKRSAALILRETGMAGFTTNRVAERATGNLIGNCVATVAITDWEGDLDKEQVHRVLDEKPCTVDVAA